jgi:putative redox protein
MDVVHVLQKGRHKLRGLRADLTGQRAPDEPRRFTAITLHYTITGDVPGHTVERAIHLSREKYCSVWHSMRQDIELTVTYKLTSGV